MLSRPFVVLYFTSLVASMGISMVSPLLPVFAEDLGATGVWIGLTFSVFAITQTLVGPFAGRWSDRFGRKPFIITGLLIYVIAAIGYFTAESFGQVIAFRAFSGIGTSLIFAVTMAYVGDIVPPRHEGRWFGVFATADIVGFGTGPLLAGVLREFAPFESVFVAMAVLMGTSTCLVTFLLPATPPGLRSTTHDAVATGFREALRHRIVVAVTLVTLLASLSWGSTFSFLAVKLEDLGTGALLIGVIFALQSISSGFFQPFTGRLADRADRRLLVIAGILILAAALIAVGLTASIWLIIGLMVVTGAGQSLAWVAGSAMQVVAGRQVGMGTVVGIGAAGEGAGIVIGAVAAGFVADQLGTNAAFIFGGCAMLAGVPLFWWLTSGDVRVSEPEPASRVAVETTR